MKVAIINDQHHGVRSDNQVFLKYMENYYQNEFFPYLDEHGIKRIVNLGDLFDRRKHINFYTLQKTREIFLDELKKRNIQMDTIPGNHDVAYKNTNKLNSLDLLLSDYENVTVYHEPTVVKYDGVKIGLVPWMNQENYDRCMQFISQTAGEVEFLGGHFEIHGVEMIPGVRSEHGLPQSVFYDHKQVISGHYHRPSVNGNIWYPGSMFEFTWADYGQEKGFVVWDTKDGLTKVKSSYTMFHKIYYDETDEFKLKKLKSQFGKLRDKYVKVIVTEKNSKTRFDQFITDLYDNDPYDVSIVQSDQEFGLSDDELNIETQSTMEIIDSTIDNMTLNVNTNELKKLFHELYSEAVNIEV